jgi:hypothetical protein
MLRVSVDRMAKLVRRLGPSTLSTTTIDFHTQSEYKLRCYARSSEGANSMKPVTPLLELIIMSSPASTTTDAGGEQ